jgi:hypothetical protein
VNAHDPAAGLNPGDDGLASWFLVTVFAAFFWFDCLLIVSDPWPASNNSHFAIYAAALFVVLPLSLMSSLLLRRVHHLQLWDNGNFLPALICLQTLYWAGVWGLPTARLLSMGLLKTILWTQPPLVLLAAALAAFSGHRRREAWNLAQRLALLALPPLSLILLWHFKGDSALFPEGRVAAGPEIIAACAGIALLLSSLVALGAGFHGLPVDWLDWPVYALIVLATLLANAGPNVNLDNLDFYLGPVNEVLAGRNLNTVVSQYGVGMVYFLAGALRFLGMKPHYEPFMFLLMALAAAQFAVLYWIVRKVFRSWLLAFLCILSVFCLGRCSYFWQWDALMVPSTGPLRFGLPILILAAGLQSRRKNSRAWAWLELGLLGVSAVWSLETFVYSLSAWGFATGAEAWALGRGLRGFLHRCLRGALGAAAAIAAAHAAFAILTLFRSGELPQWRTYLSVLFEVGGGFEAEQLDLWSVWFLLPGVVCLGLLASALATRRGEDLDPGHFCMAGAAGAAAAEFSYFLVSYRANYVSYIAPLYLVVLFYWLDLSWKRPNWAGILRWTAMPTAFFVLAAMFWACGPSIRMRFDDSMLEWLIQDSRAGWKLPFPDFYSQIWTPRSLRGPDVDAALQLIQLHAADQKQVALLMLHSEEVYSLTGKVDPFPIGYFFEDSQLAPGYFEKLAAAPLPLRAGDVLLMAQDKDGGFEGPPELPNINRGTGGMVLLAQAVQRQFKFVPLDLHPTYGIWAVRLAPLDSAAPMPKL